MIAMVFYRLLTSLTYALLQVRRLVLGATRRITGARADRRTDTGADRRTDSGRLVAPPPRTGSAPLLWLHGASNGEVTAARPLVEALLARHPGLEILITTNTRTARAMVTGWHLPRTTARIAPFDQLGLVRAFLDRQRPLALVMVENELWPNRMLECARRGLPILVLGGRMSARAAGRWRRLPGLAGRLMAAIRWLAPQDDTSRRAFLALGLAPDRLGPTLMLKALAPTPDLTTPDLATPDRPTPLPYDRARTLLAASTHADEEATVLDALQALLPRHPDLRLILAPRHPERRAALIALVRGRGLTLGVRSQGGAPDAGTQVYLADTMGEMGQWYQAAGLYFVGGSLAPRGGHTPFEPAASNSAILHGPSLHNFADAYRALDQAGAALAVQDAATLAQALDPLIGDARAQGRLAARARTALAAFRPQTDMDAFFAALSDLTGLPAA